MAELDTAVFRKALGSFATGVTVVTARGPDGRDVGVTANSFNSVSLDPPLVLWSLNSNSASLAAFTESAGFAVHILAEGQQDISNRFASRSGDRFEGIQIERGYGDAPLLKGCVAIFQCRLAFRYGGGDHVILVGEVQEFQHCDLPPLLYHGGIYGSVNKTIEAVAAPGEDRQNSELMHLVSRVYHQLFAAERQEFANHRLTEDAYLVLRLLGTRENQSQERLGALAATAGLQITAQVLDALRDRGEIASEEGRTWKLTAAGRRTVVEIAAVRLATEEIALAPFDRSEVETLKRLLRQVSRHYTRAEG